LRGKASDRAIVIKELDTTSYTKQFSLPYIMDLNSVEQLNSALNTHLKSYNIPRFKSVYFPARSLYDFNEVEFFAFGYDDFMEIPNAVKAAFSSRERISLLRDKLERMTAPVFGLDFLMQGVLKKDEIEKFNQRPAFIKQGLLIPLYGPNRFVGVIGLAANREDLNKEQIRELQVFCMSIFQRYCELKVDTEPAGKNLTPREMQTLRGLMIGKSNNEIASSLGISANTVNAYVKALYIKLHVNDRVSAAGKARELGLHISKTGMSETVKTGTE